MHKLRNATNGIFGCTNLDWVMDDTNSSSYGLLRRKLSHQILYEIHTRNFSNTHITGFYCGEFEQSIPRLPTTSLDQHIWNLRYVSAQISYFVNLISQNYQINSEIFNHTFAGMDQY